MPKRLLQAAGIAAVLAVIALVALGADFHRFSTTPLHSGEQPRRLVVESGTTVRGMVRQLAQRGLTHRPLYWRVLAWWHRAGPRMQAGEYTLEPGLTPSGLLRKLIRGDVKQYALTVVEGWRFADLRRAIAEHEALQRTLEAELSGPEVMQRIDRAGEHPEGRFLPETYRFPRGTTDVEFLRRAYDAMRETLSRVWAQRDAKLPLEGPYEALVLASLIEKETAVPAERPCIAGVFVRRLRRGMRLQTDPAVIYGLGSDFDGNLRRRDLHRDTPYNTYRRRGLPPTPIALPGVESLRAAVQPADGEALYFVAKGDGSHHFSATLREHNRAVAKYQLGREG